MFPYDRYQNAALLAVRIITAIVFAHAGYAKLFLWSIPPMEGSPLWLHYMMLFLSIAEPIAAVAILLGILTRTAGLCLSIIMVGAIAVSEFIFGYTFFTMPQAPGWDSNLMLLGLTLTLAAFGAGAWAVDRFWKKA